MNLRVNSKSSKDVASRHIAGMGVSQRWKMDSGDRYFQAKNEANKRVPEGIEGRVAYKGSAADIIFQMVGGLRSGMGYVGAHNLEELRENTQFVRMSGAGLRESHPHDVQITKEAPKLFNFINKKIAINRRFLDIFIIAIIAVPD